MGETMQYFLNSIITLRALKDRNNFQVYSATGTAAGYPASVQEPSPEKVQMYQGQIGNMWECFVEEDCPAVDADQVVISDVLYSVQNVKVMDFGGQHYKKLIIVKHGS